MADLNFNFKLKGMWKYETGDVRSVSINSNGNVCKDEEKPRKQKK